MPRIDPAVLTLNFNIGDRPVSYLSLSKTASVLNRRFYSAGLNWAVAGFRFGHVTPGVNIAVRTLPNTWVVSNAWKAARLVWDKQQVEALEASDSMEARGRYNDFKVFADTLHEGLTGALDLVPVSPGGLSVVSTDYLPAEEWIYSQIVIPNDGGVPGNTVEYNVTALGPSGVSSKSSVEGYVQSRTVPQSPDPMAPTGGVSDSWLNEMFDVGESTSEAADNAQFNNNELPYDQLIYPGQWTNGGAMQLHREISFTATTISAHQSMEGLVVPLGLIQIAHNHVSEEANTLTMQVMLVPGESRGYLTQPMKDV